MQERVNDDVRPPVRAFDDTAHSPRDAEGPLSVTELRERLAVATAALLDERERLMLRIAEIDAELRAAPNAHLPRGGTAVASVLDYLRAVTAPQNRAAIYAAAGVAPGYGDQLLRRLVAKGLVRRVAHGAYEATRSSVPGCEVSR